MPKVRDTVVVDFPCGVRDGVVLNMLQEAGIIALRRSGNTVRVCFRAPRHVGRQAKWRDGVIQSLTSRGIHASSVYSGDATEVVDAEEES